MKILTALFLLSFTISAQEIRISHELHLAPIVIENTSINILENVEIPLKFRNEMILAKKKSYKNIIEKTLSGEKHLIFKAKREVKIC